MNKEEKISLVNNNVVIVLPNANAILQVHGDHVNQVADLYVKSTGVLSVTAY